MGARIEGARYYADNICTADGGGTTAEPPHAERAPSAGGVDGKACRRAVAEEVLADLGCVGSAVWTVGSLPSVAGAVGGAMVTATACTYAGIKAADTDDACGIARRDADSALTWSSDSS